MYLPSLIAEKIEVDNRRNLNDPLAVFDKSLTTEMKVIR